MLQANEMVSSSAFASASSDPKGTKSALLRVASTCLSWSQMIAPTLIELVLSKIITSILILYGSPKNFHLTFFLELVQVMFIIHILLSTHLNT